MKFEQTIEIMQTMYPSLFYHKCNALDHLFFVNGNGYDWINGELVCEEDKQYDNKKDYMLDSVIHYLSLQITVQLSYTNRKKAEEFVKDYIYPNLSVAGKLNIIHAYDKDTVYPICQYAAIACIPDNIQPNWAQGAYEAIIWARTICTPEDAAYLDQAEIKLNSITKEWLNE